MSAHIDIPKTSHSRELQQALLQPSPESVRSNFLSSRIFSVKKSTSNRFPRKIESKPDCSEESAEDRISSAENRGDGLENEASYSELTACNSRIHVNMEVLTPAQVSGVLITLWVSVIASLLFAIYEEQWFRPKFTLDSDSSCYSQFGGQVCANLQGLNCSEKEGTIRGVLNGTSPFNGFFSLRGQVCQIPCP